MVYTLKGSEATRFCLLLSVFALWSVPAGGIRRQNAQAGTVRFALRLSRVGPPGRTKPCRHVQANTFAAHVRALHGTWTTMWVSMDGHKAYTTPALSQPCTKACTFYGQPGTCIHCGNMAPAVPTDCPNARAPDHAVVCDCAATLVQPWAGMRPAG